MAAKCYLMSFLSVMDHALPCSSNGNDLDQNYSLWSACNKDGHGLHVASIAAGNYGIEAVILNDKVVMVGTLLGMAQLSIYKVCWIDSVMAWQGQCSNANIAKAIDDAVTGGVNVINTSKANWIICKVAVNPKYYAR
ncbi:hypothetical protein ACA910_018649 [Epithemia clementina (nom. ined.)]